MDPVAVAAIKRNVDFNGVANKVTPNQGDAKYVRQCEFFFLLLLFVLFKGGWFNDLTVHCTLNSLVMYKSLAGTTEVGHFQIIDLVRI
jgi:hypothetical protein